MLQRTSVFLLLVLGLGKANEPSRLTAFADWRKKTRVGDWHARFKKPTTKLPHKIPGLTFGNNTHMTSWVWMKGVDEAVADPIDPINEHDERPSVKALLDQHSDKIDKIRQGTVDDPLFDAKKHDDLWILRFWLSHKKTKQAIAAAKTTLLFRQKYKLDDKDIRDDMPHKTEYRNIGRGWRRLRCQSYLQHHRWLPHGQCLR